MFEAEPGRVENNMPAAKESAIRPGQNLQGVNLSLYRRIPRTD